MRVLIEIQSGYLCNIPMLTSLANLVKFRGNFLKNFLKNYLSKAFLELAA